MNIALLTVGYNLPGSTATLMESALRGCSHDVTFILFSHSRFPDKVRELESLAARRDVIYKGYGENRGLAKSWNEGILEICKNQFDVILVVNEDIVFSEGDVKIIAEAAQSHRECYIVSGQAFYESKRVWASSYYACFAINPIAYERLGCFDENLFPIYYEDSDYRRRAALEGLTSWNCPDTRIQHGGSRSLSQPEVARQNHLTFRKNQEYFHRKWNGEPDKERFIYPFDDRRFTCFIDPRVREAPYPGWNRQDQHIVKF